MSQPEQFRDDVYPAEGRRQDSLRGDFSGRAETLRGPVERDAQGREFGLGGTREPVGRMTGSPLPGTPLPGSPLPGSPLPAGGSGVTGAEASMRKGVPPGRALQGPATPGEDPSAMQRAMGLLKQAAPFVARLLPLIDGNVVAAVGNLFGARSHPAQVTVDLTPVKNQLSDVQAQQTELRSTLQEHTTGLKRVEDQLELVREATDRNTLEQQELMEDLKVVAHKVNMVALGLSILLVASIVINVVLYLYVKRVLP